VEVRIKMFKWKTFVRSLKRHKDGLLIGTIVGFLAASFIVWKKIDISALTNAGKGLLDSVIGRSQPVIVLARYKLYLCFMWLGAMIGLLFDVLFNKFFKKRGR